MNLADMGTKAANENGYEVEVIEENSDADYIHDESIVSDDEFKKKLKELY